MDVSRSILRARSKAPALKEYVLAQNYVHATCCTVTARTDRASTEAEQACTPNPRTSGGDGWCWLAWYQASRAGGVALLDINVLARFLTCSLKSNVLAQI